jgi:HlyD family secretion protein
VTQAEGSLKTIQTQIEDAVIRAPFSGIVTSKYADPGDFVTPTTSGSSVSSATSSSILSLASTY